MEDEDVMSGGTAMKGQQSMAQSTMSGRTATADEDDLLGGSGGSDRPTARTMPLGNGKGRGLGENESAVGEVLGEASVPRDEASLSEAGIHEEVASAEGTESGQEFIEATPTQLESAESGEETAASDIRNLEGFEDRETTLVQPALQEAGVAIDTGEAQQEFLPFLAAVVPTLLSAIGPPVAKAIFGKLSAPAQKVIKSLPSLPRPPISLPKPPMPGPMPRPPLPLGGTNNILALIAKLLQQVGRPGGESAIEGEEAFVEATAAEAAAVIEVIIGTDDRVRISKTTEVPWRRVCALRITFPSGATYRGTGFFIGPRAIATAGHCVYLHNKGGWARKVEVIPGCNGSARPPYGQAESTSLRSVGGWVNGKKPESDYGCIVLPMGAFGGRNLGSFGFAAFDAAKILAQPAVLAGYPGDKPFAELWGMKRLIKTVTDKTLVYDIDSMGGQSGAPVYIKRNGQRYVVGIHNYGATTGNSATRITQPVYDRLLAWSKL
jgi:glutamyl endopeptidase